MSNLAPSFTLNFLTVVIHPDQSVLTEDGVSACTELCSQARAVLLQLSVRIPCPCLLRARAAFTPVLSASRPVSVCNMSAH